MKSSCSSLKYMFDYIYHGSRLLQPRWKVLQTLFNTTYVCPKWSLHVLL
jgi:hypothetical protein